MYDEGDVNAMERDLGETDSNQVAGYVLSYFTNEDEALHIAVSLDGTTFRPILGGAPALRSGVGARSIRDPFIGLGPDGAFHLLATDGWRSRNIVHAVSSDLLTWGEPELLPVMEEVAGAVNAWAPEFFTDPVGVVHLIWSSVIDRDAAPEAGEWADPAEPQRIWTTSTADFQSLKEARVFFEPGYSVIDATVIRDGDGYLMAYKDERGWNGVGTTHKCIRLARFPSMGAAIELGPQLPVSPVEGPSLFRRGEELVIIFDHFLEDRYGAMASADGSTWRPAELHVPPGMRHGSVLPVTDVGNLLSAMD